MTVWAAFWIYALQTPSVKVLTLPTWVCVAVGAVGLLVLLMGLTRREGRGTRPPQVLKQRGGDGSLNIQSGRDSNVYRRD